jgi:hypothetical protein
MRKIFGLLVATEQIEKSFNVQKSLYEKISKTFNEFFIINLIHFSLFKKKILHKNEHLNYILPHNVKVIIPKNKYELNKFLIDKNLVAFDGLGKDLGNLKIWFLVNKYNIRLIFVNNFSSIRRHYLGLNEGLRGLRTSGHRYFFVILSKFTRHSLIKTLMLFNLIKRIDICFESNKTVVNNCNNSLARKMEKIFPFLKICYFKKIIHINSRSFDRLSKLKLNLSEEKIVFIDGNFDHGDKIIREGKTSEKLKLIYYNQLEQFLLKLSNIFNKKVTICLHPSTDMREYKKYLGKFEINKYQTSENITKAFIVVFHESSGIYDALFLKKKIISLKSDALGISNKVRIEKYQKRLGLFSYSLDEKKELNKNLLQTTLEKITKNYDHYIKKEIVADDSMLGEDKIINTIRKEYFVNNTNF